MTQSTARPTEGRADSWARLTKTTFGIFLAAAALALAALGVSLAADRAHDERMLQQQLRLATEVQAQALGNQVALLSRELNRLGLRSEVDLLDQNLDPERTLLALSHQRSAFFNVGVAILGDDGRVVWSEPQEFLDRGTSFAGSRWFQAARDRRLVQVAAVRPEEDDALLYVVSAIVRNGDFAGALVGAVDLAKDSRLLPEPGFEHVATFLTRPDGVVVYPASPPPWSTEAGWLALFDRPDGGAIRSAVLGGRDSLVIDVPVPGTDLRLLSVAEKEGFFGPAHRRLQVRLPWILALALAPLGLVVLLQRRAVKLFRTAQEDAATEERMLHLGEASNLIAHEVKNSLNGIRLGLDLFLRQGANSGRVLEGLRQEIERLTSLTSELLLFSRGIQPKLSDLDVGVLAEKIVAINEPVAAERGVRLVFAKPAEIRLRADPSLLHVLLANLLSNAIDAATKGEPDDPWVELEITTTGDTLRLSVRDSGPGIPDALRGRLFEPFVSGKPSGMGIGLALSQRIAQAHGGRLVPATGKPTTFLLELPLEAR